VKAGLLVACLVGSIGAVAACGGESAGGSGGGANAPAQSEIARIHRARCGSCHVRVEPGERTREQLEAALARHRSRVHISEERWSELIDYLAAK
jgi:hypothetical protein